MSAFIEKIDRSFGTLHARSSRAAAAMPEDLLFAKPIPTRPGTFGEYILRSAGAVEQAFGGITVRLWDDPFEWTLPEELSTRSKILQYLDEVDATRRKGLGYFNADSDLLKEIPAPEEIKTIFEVLLETLARAEHFQGRAFAVMRQLTEIPPPPI